jgi:hypothetical protein
MADGKTKRTFRADADGLAVVREVAKKIDGLFDEQLTRETSDRFHQSYFEELRKILGPQILQANFEAASLRRVNAFAEAPSGEPEKVFFDEQLDFWIMTCTHLTAVAACKTLDPGPYRDLVDLFLDTLDVPADPLLHEFFRPRFKPFLIQHHDCLELSHALSRAMIVFVILREVAHITLGHTALQPSPDQEFEADALRSLLLSKGSRSRRPPELTCATDTSSVVDGGQPSRSIGCNIFDHEEAGLWPGLS